MRLLFDTHLLLWATADSPSLPQLAAKLIDDPANELVFSAASIWEVVIKSGLGRADFQVNAHLLRRGLLDNGYLSLPITAEHALALAPLPSHHKDPFDRILVAQAMAEGITLVTSDPQIAAYPGPILKL